jgi:DNA topoisomerase-3
VPTACGMRPGPTRYAPSAGQAGRGHEEAKPSTQLSPLLYDLTSLQREANGRFGFSAKATLGLAQALYEKHKVLTYPRTDARALPEDYLATVKATLDHAAGEGSAEGPDPSVPLPYAPFAAEILKRRAGSRPNKRIFNNAKISDHFAIIPTLQAPKACPSRAEALRPGGQALPGGVLPGGRIPWSPRASRASRTNPSRPRARCWSTPAGWPSTAAKAQEARKATWSRCSKRRRSYRGGRVNANETRPPARYSEATLLSAMEGAGKMVDDEELRAAMAGRGLGTPATRAQIIENLIGEQYMHREGANWCRPPRASR